GIDILVSAGVAIIIIAILKKVIKNNVLLFIVFAFSIAYAPKILPVLNPDTSSCLFFYSLFWGNTSWSYFPIFPWLAYPITGYSIKLLEDKIKVKKTFLIAAGMLSIFPIMFTASFGINISTNLRRYYHHGYDFFLWSLFFMLIWISSLWIIEYNFSSSMVIIYLKWVGKNVTSFYIFQWLIIGNIATAVYKTVSQKKLVLWFIAILITTNALVLLLNKIRCSKHK
ncbi:hypothetical protein KAJ27_08980, partial [bacterium]|nr:hypothetical protein [bacterium]